MYTGDNFNFIPRYYKNSTWSMCVFFVITIIISTVHHIYRSKKVGIDINFDFFRNFQETSTCKRILLLQFHLLCSGFRDIKLVSRNIRLVEKPHY